MTTIINRQAPSENNGGSGILIGGLIVLGLIILFAYVGVPMIRRMNPVQMTIPAPQVNMEAPVINIPAPQINVQAPDVPTQTP